MKINEAELKIRECLKIRRVNIPRGQDTASSYLMLAEIMILKYERINYQKMLFSILYL
jgi:hypothetical protein